MKRQKNSVVFMRMCSKWNVCALLLGMSTSAARTENATQVAQKWKNYHRTQQFQFCVFIQRKWKYQLRKIRVSPCSFYHQLQPPKYANKLYQGMNKDNGVFSYTIYTHIHNGVLFSNEQEFATYGWTLSTLCQVKQGRSKYLMNPLTYRGHLKNPTTT